MQGCEEQKMFGAIKSHISEELKQINDSGLYKAERIITSPQNATITVQGGQRVLNLCANNYLGLADHPEVIQAARDSYEKWGYGLASVRFICGTQEIHKQLEKKISDFLGTEDTILYSSCFDANTGLFEALLSEEDAVISDQLNHASIIDGVRLCKAQRLRFENSNMQDLEDKLQQARPARFRLIATDGVFSMDGTIARLDQICKLAEKYDALVMVDDSHGVGVLGKRGRGTHEYCDVIGRVDIITGTLGKALGGASGGYTSGRKEIIEILRQRSRPYLFSNTVAPAIVAASLKVLDILSYSADLRDKLMNNTRYFREEIARLGLHVIPGQHPIVPIMLGDALIAQQMAEKLLEKSVYVIGFSYPVVPKGAARIRVQISAAHSKNDLHFAIKKIAEVKQELGI
jgi:glycine C-acetyltransferase